MSAVNAAGQPDRITDSSMSSLEQEVAKLHDVVDALLTEEARFRSFL